jgi:cellulose biosynthesis protein BcsQ
MTSIRFDEVIPATIEILNTYVARCSFETTMVRDSFGALTVVLPDDALTGAGVWNNLALQLHQALGVYSPGEGQVLLRQKDLIDASDIFESPDRVHLADLPNTWLVDRLQTNQDWLREPFVQRPPIRTAVAFSIKGGVGRTTAFALWAWSLARAGKSVLLVDLDLEAPGVAGLLLSKDRMPDYGLVDWLIEALNGQADEALLRDCLVDCALASNTPGRIQVLPAFGTKTREYVNKLGRVYMPTFAPGTGKFIGLAERLLLLLEQLSNLSNRPDLVMLDSRAGLHDIGSAAVTRLGAETFMFARDDYQSWQAYAHLFEQLSHSRSVAVGMNDDDLRWRLKMVGAQVDTTESAKLRFTEASYSVWSDKLYDEGTTPNEEIELKALSKPIPQVFDLKDDSAPHFPLFVQFDSRVKGFDLVNPENRPDWNVIETAFGGFFAGAAARTFQNGVDSSEPQK